MDMSEAVISGNIAASVEVKGLLDKNCSEQEESKVVDACKRSEQQKQKQSMVTVQENAVNHLRTEHGNQ